MREGFLVSRCERYSDLPFPSTKNPWRLRCNKRGFPVYSDVKTISDLLVPLSQGTQYSLTYSGRRIIVQLTFMWFHDLSFEKARKSLKNEDASICPDIPLATFKTVILAPFLAGDYIYPPSASDTEPFFLGSAWPPAVTSFRSFQSPVYNGVSWASPCPTYSSPSCMTFNMLSSISSSEREFCGFQ